MKVEENTFPSPPEFIHGSLHQFIIVPTKTVFSAAGGQRVASENFQFGVRKKGETAWKYFQGSRVTPEAVRRMFRDFPPGITFPECRREKL